MAELQSEMFNFMHSKSTKSLIIIKVYRSSHDVAVAWDVDRDVSTAYYTASVLQMMRSTSYASPYKA